jgi:ubiquinone/menaquinone biosynthesis C-methylase UbiE
MAANYDNSAWFYDQLARLVYGKALVNAQVYLLEHIPVNATVLIAGGGTGWILEELARIHPSGLKITYVDVSINMINLAKKRNCGANEVTLINRTIENTHLPNDFDVVLTPFLLDNFLEENMVTIFKSINLLLKKNGLWLNASFQLTGKFWQQALLKTMFIFFRVICGIEASKLPPINKCFVKYGYALLERQGFFGNFIAAGVYRK